MMTDLSRRQFFGLAAVAAVGPLADFECLLESARPAKMTLVDFAIRNHDPRLLRIAEILAQANDALDDLAWIENDAPVSIKLAPGYWRKIYPVFSEGM